MAADRRHPAGLSVVAVDATLLAACPDGQGHEGRNRQSRQNLDEDMCPLVCIVDKRHRMGSPLSLCANVLFKGWKLRTRLHWNGGICRITIFYM